MDVINFEQYRPEILKALENRLKTGVISDPNGFILLDGFINMPLQKEMGGAFIIGGPTIPAVAVVGKSSGLIYTFALKVLIPNINL